MEEFDIYIGSIADDRVEPPAVRLTRVFGLPDLRAYEFVASLPRVVKRYVPADQVERYGELLRAIGAEFELRRSPIRPAQTIGVAGRGALAGAEEPPDAHGSLLALPDLRHGDLRGTRLQATIAGPAVPAAPPAPEAPAPPWNPATAPTLRESRPPPPHNQQTLREAALPEILALPYVPPRRSERPPAQRPRSEPPPPERPQAEPLPSDWTPPERPPERPRSDRPPPQPGASARPAPPVAPPAWGSIEPATSPAPRPMQGRPLVPDERPPWLAIGADKYADDLEQLSSPPAPEPLPSERPSAHDSRLPARPKGSSPFAVYSTGRAVHPGAPAASDPRPEPPFVLRLGVRLMLGGSLFLMLTSVRHCHLMPTDVEDALAEWNAPSSASSGVAALGPIALDWLASDRHQVTSGDKDRARGIAERLKAAGAVEVYVGAIMNSGATQLAGELLVELPQDEAKRKAVLDEHSELMTGTFGGVEIAPQAANGSVLRVTF